MPVSSMELQVTVRRAPKTRLDDCISEAMPVLLSSFGFTKREAEVAFKMSGGCIQVASYVSNTWKSMVQVR